MLHALAKHAGWSLALNCKGDLHSTFFVSTAPPRDIND
jgi:imidazoleglycerol phosphate dehydratase HisB